VRTNALHVQFEFIFHFEMNRCFCVDETQGLVLTTSCTPLVSCLLSVGAEWDKTLPSKVSWDGHKILTLSRATFTNEWELKGWLVHFAKIWVQEVRCRLQWLRESWEYRVSGNRKNFFSFLLFPDTVSLLVYRSFLICFSSNPEKGLLGWGIPPLLIWCFKDWTTDSSFKVALKLGILKLGERKEPKFSMELTAIVYHKIWEVSASIYHLFALAVRASFCLSLCQIKCEWSL